MSDDIPVNHTDFKQPSQAQISHSYSESVTYDQDPLPSEYGPITTRFDESITLKHPAPDLETLRQTTHLTAQLHAYNRSRQEGEWPYPNDGTTLYELAVLDVIEEYLTEYDLPPPDLDMPTRRFRVAVLKQARNPSTHKAFVEYLQNAEPVLTELGYPTADALPGYETLRVATEDTLPETLNDHQQDKLEEAVVRTTYDVYRNGVEVPASINAAFGFDTVAPPLAEKDVPRQHKQTALQNWVQYLIDETLDALTFNRSKPRTTFRQYIGLFAASALYNCGVQQVANISDYTYSRDLIPSGSGVGKYIRDDNLPLNEARAALSDTEQRSITTQFGAVHRATLEIAETMGFFDEPRSVAVDLYRIDWDGEETELTINRPAKADNDIRSQWTFAVFGVIDTDARFTLGTRWLQSKDAYPQVVQSLAPIAEEFLDVQALYADSEIVSGSLIEAFGRIADEDWITRAPDQPIVKLLRKQTPANHIGYIPNVSWNTHRQSTLVAYPYNSSEPSMLKFSAAELKQAADSAYDDQMNIENFLSGDQSSDRGSDSLTSSVEDRSMEGVGDEGSHAAYLTGRSLPARSPAGIHFNYYQRWAIEETLNQVSNDVMPVVHAKNEKLRFYGMNLAVLFQNWHTLINRAISPELALPRNVVHQELLRAIETVAFTNSD